MRSFCFAMPRPGRAALILAVAVVLAGCDEQVGSSAPADTVAEPAAEPAAELVTETEQASPTTAQHDPDDGGAVAPDADADADIETAGPVEGNVITRNLPRFHDAFESDRAYLDWMETFYIHKQFERTPEAIGYFCSSKLFEDMGSRIPMSVFFGAILAQSDQTVDLCYNELTLEARPDELIMLGYAAWFANTPTSREMTLRARTVWTGDDVFTMFNLTHRAKQIDSMDRAIDEDPSVLRMIWYEFFATGDEDRLRKVVRHAYMYNAPEGSWQRQAGLTARAPLLEVLPVDPLVYRVVEEEAAVNPSGPIRSDLSRLLKEVGPLRPRPGTSATP